MNTATLERTDDACMTAHRSAGSTLIKRMAAAARALLTRKSIGYQRIGTPTLIAKDLIARGVPPAFTYEVLLKRGVFKWLAVRRELLKLKITWKSRVTTSILRQHALMAMQHQLRGSKDRADQKRRAKMLRQAHEERGYRRGIEQARAEVRALCHSDRWQAPDNDRAAKLWLAKREA